MKLFKAMATVAGMTFLSRIFGFGRDILTAGIMGAGPLADAFFVALKLPNFFRRISAEGAFSVSFVPLFSESLEKDGQDKAVAMARNMMGIMTVVLTLFCLICMVLMPYVINVIAPGFSEDPVRYGAAVELSRVTFPYLLLISLAALAGGVMNSVGRFGVYAFLPSLFNITLIATLLLNDVVWQSPAHALAWGVFIAGFVQLAWIVFYGFKHGIRLYPVKPVFDDKVKRLFTLMLPGLLGAGVVHVNLFADMIIASFLPEGSISYLYYADRLHQLPLGVIGIAVGTALLPLLSRAISGDRFDEARDLFNRALEACFILALPAAVALGLAAEPIIRSLFQYGAFNADDAVLTGMVLSCYAIGLPAYIAAKVFQSACFARQDTKTPVKISVICSLANIVMAVAFSRMIGVAGIGLATGIAGWVQIILLYVVLKRQGRLHFDNRFRKNALKIILSSLIMGFIILLYLSVFKQYFDVKSVERVAALIGLVGLGGLTYALSIMAFKVMTLKELKSLVNKKSKSA